MTCHIGSAAWYGATTGLGSEAFSRASIVYRCRFAKFRLGSLAWTWTSESELVVGSESRIYVMFS